MKKKRLFTTNICILIVILFTVTIYGKTDDNERRIKELITLRTEILQDYYHNYKNYNETLKRLTEIESHSLLDDDSKNLKKFSYTDVDYVKNFKIRVDEIKESSHGMINGTTRIYWEMEGVNGNYNTEGSYYFVVEKNNHKLKITQFKKI